MRAFAKLHPAVDLVYFLCVLSVCMFVPHPVLEAEALVGGALFCAVSGKRGDIKGELLFYIPMFFIAAAVNPLFSHNGVTPLFFLNGNPVTLEALLYGVSMAAALVGVLLWCKAYGAVMTSDKHLYLFGRLWPRLALVLSSALRFIPVFLRQSRRVSRAQKAMGIYSGKSLTDRIKNKGRVLSSMVLWSLENAVEVSAAMKARGYGCGRKRTSFSLFRMRAGDKARLFCCLALYAAVISAVLTGDLNFSFYPKIGEISLSAAAFSGYAAFGALSLMPFAEEIKEAVQWRYCVSKI